MSPLSVPWDPGFGITYLKQLLKQLVLVHLKVNLKLFYLNFVTI